ncbi:MFS transporter [Leucobacter denitrificans]|uniref:MFS transporter n=1 Tax=Leucobacter denitrificans TaxID=683042 RepID=A0A7G9S2D1_9MICO|nr:MFS transporter [Leucobacter denitrificans]QNN62006.1 MFS transporter [Leucobacter denitrificans]
MLASDRRQGFSAGLLVLAIGLSVRFPITSVSPVLREIGDEFALSPSELALLSAIPVLLFGVAAPLAPVLVARLGLNRAITILLATLAIATLLRPLTTPLLFAGTVVVGSAISLLGILAPQYIRQSLPARGGLWTGVYTTSFGVSAAVGAAFTVPLFHAFGEQLEAALMFWAIPLLIAFGVALGSTRASNGGPHRAPTPRTRGNISTFRTPGIWPVTGFFACQALIYFSLTAWLPTLAVARGMGNAEAGLTLAWMSIIGLPAALIFPTLASRARWRTRLVVGVAIVSAVGLGGLALAPVGLLPTFVALLGLAQSAAFGLAVALIVFTAPSSHETAAFSAVSQGVGYLVAAIGPLVVGLLADVGIGWREIVLTLIAASVGELLFGIGAARASETT